MITLVDVTGSYIFGFGSRSAVIGSLTCGISPLKPMKIGSYSIATSSRITSIKSPKNITTFVRFATMLRFEHSFVKTAKLSSSYSIVKPDNFTTVIPAKVFTNNAINNIYKYAGLRTPKLFTILRDVKLRFDGDIGSLIYLPKIGNIIIDSPLNKPLDKIAFSFCDPGEVLSVKFYLDTELFKTSTIKALSPLSIKGFQDIFGGTSTITPPVIVSLTDSNFTTVFNYGSGMNTSFLANILTNLNYDYSTTPFTGMRIVKIYSAVPPGWQQTDQTYQQPTKILIQFWS
jgi:hypothetical protein